MPSRLGVLLGTPGTSKTSISGVRCTKFEFYVEIVKIDNFSKNPEGNWKMGDQIFLLIFVELFCGVPAAEIRGPSELWGARRLHITFRMRETCPKSAGEKLAAGIIAPRSWAKWRLRMTG